MQYVAVRGDEGWNGFNAQFFRFFNAVAVFSEVYNLHFVITDDLDDVVLGTGAHRAAGVEEYWLTHD